MDGGVLDERILAPAVTSEFLWIVIVSSIGAVFAAFGIGANDLANAFATSVGARALTIKQAVVLAGVFEFLGAVFLGSHVAKTIRSGIADYQPSTLQVGCFVDNPGILMYGNMCVVYTSGFWLLLASFFELPVSTTHATVGGIVGMAMTYRGADCVVWYEEAEFFPYLKGVSAIVASWALSPVLSAVIAVALYFFMRTFVLRADQSQKKAINIFPCLVTVTIAVNVFFILYKGAKSLGLERTTLPVAFAWAFGLGGVVGGAMYPTVLPYIRRNIAAKYHDDGTRKSEPRTEKVVRPQPQSGVIGFVMNQMNQDIYSSVKDSEYVNQIHDNAEKFDPRTEEVFKYVQIFTAICDSFSHGANDVANAMGPFASIYFVYTTGEVREDGNLGNNAFWILAFGGLGMVAGLALYGYNIIAAIGVKIAKITPSRGFAIELGSALTVIIGTRLEIPLSTTHCQVGATAGVALLEGSGGVNGIVLAKAIFGWVVTIVVCGLTCSALFAQGAYAPYAYDIIDDLASTSSSSP
ncbi:PiT family transporter: phosphate [Ectocarpus siliculosus]|uniref:Phosphate transporter n=1 Tax=Ectocarpus siliculosus TaxID=2880 RepID=D7FWT9_ECTSI|nr:PiT family transporter: phosphate [Ectocarpus siliculosus]|eukprot:CBJ32177.1 PiT family transporter: phosphate [Ectocarpus siliculosus]